jgi:hypothetical protein
MLSCHNQPGQDAELALITWVGGLEYIGRTMSLSWLCSAAVTAMLSCHNQPDRDAELALITCSAAVTASPPFVVMLSAPMRSP